MTDRVVWFDLPVADLDRATRFYAAMRQAEKNGGRVLKAVESIGQHGFRAIVLDSEGNRIALHSSADK